MKFDHYFSLGVNCEGAYQIRRILGHDSSCFFSWNVTKFESLVAILRNDFDGVLQRENLTPRPGSGLIHDSSYDFMFHSPFKDSEEWSGPAFEEKLQALQKKFVYLINKFRRIAESGESVVYFYRTEDKDNVRQKAITVAETLKNMHHNDQFRLVVLQSDVARESDWGEQFIHNRYMKRFAPWSDATDGHVASWDRVFSEFQHAHDDLRLSGFDKVSDPLKEK